MIYKIEGKTLFQVDENGKETQVEKFDHTANLIHDLRKVFKDNKEMKESILTDQVKPQIANLDIPPKEPTKKKGRPKKTIGA